MNNKIYTLLILGLTTDHAKKTFDTLSNLFFSF